MAPENRLLKLLTVILIFGTFMFVSCEKEILIDDPHAKLVFSADTVLFDTIFTTIGSSTRHFKVLNPYDNILEISSIRLSGSPESPYRINVDGISGNTFNNILLPGGDSIYIFVEATIDPVDGDLPMVIEDSVVFVTNGNMQVVKLVAWGQDVNILEGRVFETETLIAGKPYLVYDYLLVDSGQVLNIEPGVRIHFHRNSGLYVSGSINAAGTCDDPVVFEGARTESSYRNIPGQWEGIWLMPGSSGNRLVNARVRNAVNGILADTVGSSASTTLYLSNSRIENMTHAGIFARGAVVYADNSVIANCGFHSVALTSGGDYTFNHCTIANYWNLSSRQTPSVIIENYYTDIAGKIQLRPVKALFGNSIIYGSRGSEVGLSVNPEANFEVSFNHCLVSVETNLHAFLSFNNSILDLPPDFIDPLGFNYRLSGTSPAIDTGDPDIGYLYPFDHEGKIRPYGDGPDMGAFEWHAEE